VEAASFWLSAAAVVISIVFAIRQERLSRKVAGIDAERRRDEVEARLVADVTASFETKSSASGEEPYLVLLNRGPAHAVDVDFTYPETDDLTIFKNDMGFPVTLDPGQPFAVLASPSYGAAPSVPITLRWTDGRGPQEKQLRLPSP
jgi:hypothetical protein